MGSLGQQRFVAIGSWEGGHIAREAKAILPSACVWLQGHIGRSQSYYEKAIQSAVRSHDPFQKIRGTWLIRRLSPESNPLRLPTCPKSATKKRFSMPWARKPRMFTWEVNAKSSTFLGTCGAENQIGCVLRPGKWPEPWKAIGRSTGTLEASSPSGVCSGHSAIGDVAVKTEAPSFTGDIVRSSFKLQSSPQSYGSRT
jgi:hypothetical protein